MALKLDVLANTRQFVSEMKKAGASTEDISDALDELARQGKADGDKLERTFKDLAREAKKTDQAVERIGQEGPGSFRKLGDAGSEVSGELRQNLGETFSSFRGDLADLPQIAQDTLGGLAGAGALGGIAGLAVTAAGAAGLGLITAELTKQQEQAEELKGRLSSAYQTAAEEGRAFLDTSQLIAEAYSLMFDPARAEEYKRIREDANRLGLDEATVIDANSGSLEAQEQVLERINGLREELASKPRQDGIMGTQAYDEEKKQLDEIEGRWTAANDVAQQYADTAQAASQQAAARQAEERKEIDKTRLALEGLIDRTKKPQTLNYVVRVDDSQLRAAQQAAKQWADRGLNVAVTGTLSGRTWE